MKNKRIEAEVQRLQGLLDRGQVTQIQRDALAPVIDNLAWMRIKLEDTREAIKTSTVAIPYDNGGGQTGVRENPLYKGYTNLLRSYVLCFEKLQAVLPRDLREETGADITILEKVRDMRAKA